MAPTSKIFLTVTIFLSLVYKSSAIHCYYCSSQNNAACLDPLEYDDATRVRLIPAVQCEANITSMDPRLRFFCRKLVQTIYLPDEAGRLKAELRVARGCGWVAGKDKCYKNDHVSHLETSCQCFSDFCNSADNLEPVTATMLFLVLSACLYFYR